jgi:hypothetical protein
MNKAFLAGEKEKAVRTISRFLKRTKKESLKKTSAEVKKIPRNSKKVAHTA